MKNRVGIHSYWFNYNFQKYKKILISNSNTDCDNNKRVLYTTPVFDRGSSQCGYGGGEERERFGNNIPYVRHATQNLFLSREQPPGNFGISQRPWKRHCESPHIVLLQWYPVTNKNNNNNEIILNNNNNNMISQNNIF